MFVSSDELDGISDEDFTPFTAERMLYLLQSTYLEVVIDRERCVRLVVTENTKWYKDFCARYVRFRRRRWRTIIKRCCTVSALQRLMAEDCVDSIYEERLLEVIDIFWDTYTEKK